MNKQTNGPILYRNCIILKLHLLPKIESSLEVILKSTFLQVKNNIVQYAIEVL